MGIGTLISASIFSALATPREGLHFIEASRYVETQFRPQQVVK
jgi:hypothetical protein